MNPSKNDINPFSRFLFPIFSSKKLPTFPKFTGSPPKTKKKKQTEIVRGASIKLRLRRKWHHGVFSFTVCVCAPDRLSQIHVPLRHNGSRQGNLVQNSVSRSTGRKKKLPKFCSVWHRTTRQKNYYNLF